MSTDTPINTETTPLVNCPKTKEEIIEQARKILYLSHFCAQFSEIGWQFCLILFLTALTDYRSLIFVSSYGLFTGISSCLFGSTVGALIDDKQKDRLVMARTFIWAQNTSVFLATFCCFLLLRNYSYQNDDITDPSNTSESTNVSNILAQVIPSTNTISWALLLAAVHIFGGLAQVLDQGFSVAIERDWVVEMSLYYSKLNENDPEECTCSGNSGNSGGSETSFKSAGMNSTIIEKMRQEQWLSQTNTTMTQIDLSCKVLAPAVSGIFIEFYENANQSDYLESELAYAALIVGMLNMVSLIAEYIFSKMIYDLIPNLQERNVVESIGKGKDEPAIAENEEICESSTISEIETEQIPESSDRCDFCIPRGLSIYMKQSVTYAGIALALLYFNVLTFGPLMTAYLVSRGMDFDTIGIWRGVSCIIGICGTLGFHLSMTRRSLTETGMLSMTFQFSCLSLSFLSIFVENRNLSFTMLIAGVCSSRMGLWSFDLAAKQLFQQYIPDDIRGVVGGVQDSLNALLGLGSFILGLIYSDPNDFGILMTVSFCNIGAATIIFFFGTYRRQDSIEMK